jgi:hypothetical protein
LDYDEQPAIDCLPPSFPAFFTITARALISATIVLCPENAAYISTQLI